MAPGITLHGACATTASMTTSFTTDSATAISSRSDLVVRSMTTRMTPAGFIMVGSGSTFVAPTATTKSTSCRARRTHRRGGSRRTWHSVTVGNCQRVPALAIARLVEEANLRLLETMGPLSFCVGRAERRRYIRGQQLNAQPAPKPVGALPGDERAGQKGVGDRARITRSLTAQTRIAATLLAGLH